MRNALIAQPSEEMGLREFHTPKNSASPGLAKKAAYNFTQTLQRGGDQVDADFRLFRLAFKY